jgi:type I restriction enzyme S subunit
MVNRTLPTDWEWTTVADTVKNISLTGKKLPQRDYLETGKIPVVDQGQEFIGGYTDLEELVVKCDPPVIVFGDHTKAIKFVPMPFVAGADGIKVLKPSEHFNPKLFYYFLQAIELPDKGYARHFQYLEKAEIPVPPLPEQERIVNRIEELFSDLDVGVASLARVQVGLQRYKMSVLKAACEGNLLESKEAEGGELPEGWRWVRMEEIAETIGGATKGRKLEGKSTIMLPYLRVANVQRGRLELEVMKEIEILESEIEKYRLHDGDVVLTEGGDWDKLGRSAIWRNQIPNCIHQNHIFRARVKALDVLPEWLMYYTNSELGQNYFKEASKQTTNLASINLTQLRACPIPLPPLDEQRRIVAEVERRLSVVGEVESAVEVGLVRAGRLRQSVLRSAFEGRL